MFSVTDSDEWKRLLWVGYFDTHFIPTCNFTLWIYWQPLSTFPTGWSAFLFRWSFSCLMTKVGRHLLSFDVWLSGNWTGWGWQGGYGQVDFKRYVRLCGTSPLIRFFLSVWVSVILALKTVTASLASSLFFNKETQSGLFSLYSV